jgi:hypothetical protein
VALGWLWLGCAVAQARIGETEKQCEERYGKRSPVPTDTSLYAYYKPPFILLLHFIEGRCDFISYIKAEENTPEIRGEFSEDERGMLRSANGAGRAWKQSPTSNDQTIRFEATDGQLGSIYATDTRILTIVTRDAHKRLEDWVKSREEKNLKGSGK